MAASHPTRHPHLDQARADAEHHGIPEDGYQAYRNQFNAAQRRRIEWQFTLPEWWAWWQQDARWARRGRDRDGLVMARRGDAGPYSPENTYAGTPQQNADAMPTARRSEIMSKAFDRRGQRRQPAPDTPLPVPKLPTGWPPE